MVSTHSAIIIHRQTGIKFQGNKLQANLHTLQFKKIITKIKAAIKDQVPVT
jgi:hypothetical protein